MDSCEVRNDIGTCDMCCCRGSKPARALPSSASDCLLRWGLPHLHEHPAVPKFRTLSPSALNRLPRRTLGGRDLKTLQLYRSFIRNMLGNSDGSKSALELTSDEVKRVATVKRLLRKAASEEGVNISVEKRGNFLVFEKAN